MNLSVILNLDNTYELRVQHLDASGIPLANLAILAVCAAGLALLGAVRSRRRRGVPARV